MDGNSEVNEQTSGARSPNDGVPAPTPAHAPLEDAHDAPADLDPLQYTDPETEMAFLAQAVQGGWEEEERSEISPPLDTEHPTEHTGSAAPPSPPSDTVHAKQEEDHTADVADEEGEALLSTDQTIAKILAAAKTSQDDEEDQADPWLDEEAPWSDEEKVDERDISPLLPSITPKTAPPAPLEPPEPPEAIEEATERPQEVPAVTLAKDEIVAPPVEAPDVVPDVAIDPRDHTKEATAPLVQDYVGMDPSLSSKQTMRHRFRKKAWTVIALLLLVLAAGVVSQTEWWILTWYNLRNPHRLVSMNNQWHKRNFGTVLILEGIIDRNDRHHALTPPMVHITLLDQQNQPLLSTHVVPGRVVSSKILRESGAQAIREMILLQRRKRTEAELAPSEQRIPFQAIFVNPPEEGVRFLVNFNAPGAAMTQAGTAPLQTRPSP